MSCFAFITLNPHRLVASAPGRVGSLFASIQRLHTRPGGPETEIVSSFHRGFPTDSSGATVEYRTKQPPRRDVLVREGSRSVKSIYGRPGRMPGLDTDRRIVRDRIEGDYADSHQHV